MTLRLSPGGITSALVAAGAAVGGVLVLGLAALAGPVVAIGLIAGGMIALLVLSHARLAVGLALGSIILAEGDPTWGVPATAHLYAKTPVFFTPVELLALLALAAVVLDAVRRGDRLRMPRAFAVPLLMAAGALLFGLVNSHLSGPAPGYAVRSALQTMLPLFLVPVLVVNVVRSRKDLRTALGITVGLALAKAIAGLGVLASGRAQLLAAGGPHMTYYEAAGNVLLMLVVVGLGGAMVARQPIPRWMKWAFPLVFACLLLSYRRMFWIATVSSLLIVAIVASGRVGRRLVVPAAFVLVGTVWLMSQAHIAGGLSGPIAQRAGSITPSKVTRNTQDRYRIAERHNVIADLRTHPIAGAGIGVGWQMTYPLPFEYPEGRRYVHFAVLWWWLNMGVLGAITYGWLMLSMAQRGIAVWRRHPDGVVRVAGLAAGIGVLGLALAELTFTMVGPDQRGTAVFGAALGLLAVAHSHLRPSGDDGTVARLQ